MTRESEGVPYCRVFILMPEPRDLPGKEAVKACFAQKFGEDPVHIPGPADTYLHSAPGVGLFSLNLYSRAFAPQEGRVLEKAVERSLTLSDFGARFVRQHQAFMQLQFSRAGSTPLQNDLEALQFLSTLLQVSGRCVVFWNFSLIEKMPFLQLAQTSTADNPPLDLWISFGLVRREEFFVANTYGLTLYGLNDIEVRADSSSDEAKALSLCKEEALKLFVQGTTEAQLGPSCLEKIEGEVYVFDLRS